MKLIEKILFATDFSESAARAAKTATELAVKFGSEIVPVHVMPKLDVPGVTMKMVKNAADKELKQIVSQMENVGVTVQKPLLLKGNPFLQIINQAELLDVNVIVMGAGDRAAGQKVKLGTTAEKVIRKSQKPVWAVTASRGINRILCPVDMSHASKRALKNAIHLARVVQAELTVMLVVKSYAAVLKGMGDDVVKSVQKAAKEKDLAGFKKFLAKFNFGDLEWHSEVRYGIPSREIVKLAREKKADLLIMGSVGMGASRLSLMGTVAEKVLREMPCSVVTVKAEDAIQVRLNAEMKDIHVCADQGEELLKNGMADEAVTHFQHCLGINSLYVPAWEGIAKAHEQMGRKAEAEKYRKKVKEVQEEALSRRITADMRSRRFVKKGR